MIDVWRSSKYISGISRTAILRITLAGSFSVLNLLVVCLQSCWKYFPKFSIIATFQDNGRLHISSEIIAMSCFPCSICFKKYVKYGNSMENYQVFRWKIISWSWNQKILISKSCYPINFCRIFWKIWVYWR